MAIPWGLIIGAAGTAAGLGVSAYQSKKNRQYQQEQNERDRQFTQEQYEKQRQDALEDFHMQNQFNDPKQQMTRLRQAGLNPNLVYGKGAETTAASIRGSSPTNQKQEAQKNTFDPSMIGGFSNALAQHADLTIKQAQTDNLNTQNALMSANMAKTLQETARGDFELGQAKRLKDLVVDNAILNNEKAKVDIESTIAGIENTQANTIYTLDKNQREELANSTNTQATLQSITNQKLQNAKTTEEIEVLKLNQKMLEQNINVAELDSELAKMGIRKDDPLYYRYIMQLVNAITDSGRKPAATNDKQYWDAINKIRASKGLKPILPK